MIYDIATAAQPVQQRFLRLKEVVQRVGLSKSTLYAMIKNGSFPAPKKISARCIGWEESTIHNWIDERRTASE